MHEVKLDFPEGGGAGRGGGVKLKTSGRDGMDIFWNIRPMIKGCNPEHL